MMFSTFDRDNDNMEPENCAERKHGAWWHAGPLGCTIANLNGDFEAPFPSWRPSLNAPGTMTYEQLISTEMKFRRIP